MMKDVYTAYYEALVDTDREAARNVIHTALQNGMSAEDLVLSVLSPALEQFADDFINKTKTLAQHFLSSTISGELIEELLEQFQSPPERAGVVILGTAEGDFHGLGKKIVGGFLTSALYEVIDLGTNVAPEDFVAEAVRHRSAVIGVSSMMVHTALGERGAKGVRRILDDQQLGDSVKLVVGGAPFKFDDDLWEETGADAWARDAQHARKVLDELLGDLA